MVGLAQGDGLSVLALVSHHRDSKRPIEVVTVW
jgi:hypothetical protein